MSDQAILTEDRDGILVITINRPDARNAVNGDVANGMAEALDRLDADDDLRVGIVTGAGGFFSAGLGPKGVVQGEAPDAAHPGLPRLPQRAARQAPIAPPGGLSPGRGLGGRPPPGP